MPHDAGAEIKARLRADLRAAMTGRRAAEAKVLRSLIAALDNAEAPPDPGERSSAAQHQFHDGSAEVERLLLDRARVRDVLLAEIQERERAAVEMERLSATERAGELLAEAQVARRYVE